MARPLVTWQLFLKASSLQRKRAVLTVAAIAWGTVAILMLLAFGQGLREQLMRGRRGMGENIAVVWPGETSKIWEGLPTGRAIRPRMEDIEYLRHRIPDVRFVGEITSWSTTLSYGRKTITGRVTGTNWEYGDLRNHYPQPGGRFLNPLDEIEKRRVAFVGDAMAKEIFGSENPVGRILQINRAPYLVIGVMQHKLQMGAYGGPDEDHVVVPITTFSAQLGRQRLNNIVFKVDRPGQMVGAIQRFRQVLGKKYRFDPQDKQVLGIWDTVRGARIMDNITIGIRLFLGIVGALTLLVGSVGVANIMYAVVKEKTREIGVQMALGARRGWVTGPIVMQGLVYTLLGGATGLLIAVVLVMLIGLVPTAGNQALEFLGKPTLSWPIAAATAAILGTLGILSGYFPARRAAGINPAETLRYE
ncbi:MAG: ABC transporter permease [Acidobacteria bacterium]|jgi:putative ABC transport system permease protein|nr:ABC transporter permease [Acidobacteriota bacterium]